MTSRTVQNVIGQLLHHSLWQALIVYIRLYPVPKLTCRGRGLPGDCRPDLVESVSSRLCVLCWSVEDPWPLSHFQAKGVFENRRRSQRFCWCGAEANAGPVSCPFKGIAESL